MCKSLEDRFDLGQLARSKGAFLDLEDYDHIIIEEYQFETLRDTDEIWYYEHRKGIFAPKGEPIIEAPSGIHFGRSRNSVLTTDNTV